MGKQELLKKIGRPGTGNIYYIGQRGTRRVIGCPPTHRLVNSTKLDPHPAFLRTLLDLRKMPGGPNLQHLASVTCEKDLRKLDPIPHEILGQKDLQGS